MRILGHADTPTVAANAPLWPSSQTSGRDRTRRKCLHSDRRTSGFATADRDFISDAARTASPKQIAAFNTALAAKDPAWRT
jgi:pyocin large subunit-like protein